MKLVLSLSLLLTGFEGQIFETCYVHSNPIMALQLIIWPYVSLYNPWGFRCFDMLCSIVAQVVLDISKENCVFIFTCWSVPYTPLWQHHISYILGKFQIFYKLKCINAYFTMLLFFLHLFITQGLPDFWHSMWSYSY
jgi:hypothetical protein